MKRYSLSLILLIWYSNSYGLFEYDQALYKAQQGDWQSSVDLFKKLLTEEPGNAQTLYDAGVSSFHVKDYSPALSYFKKAAEQTDIPQILREKSYFNAGNTLVELKQLQEAIDAYDQVLSLNPNHKEAAHNKEVVKKMLEQEKKEQEKKQDNKQQQNEEKKNDSSSPNQNNQLSSSNKDNNEADETKENKNNNQQQQEQPNNKDTEQSDSQDQQKPQQDSKNDSNPNAGNPQEKENNGDQQQQQQKNKQADDHQKQERESAAHQEQSNQKNAPQAGSQEQQEQSASSGTGNEQLPLTPGLARILEETEKKDTDLHKKMIKVMVGSQGGSANDTSGW